MVKDEESRKTIYSIERPRRGEKWTVLGGRERVWQVDRKEGNKKTKTVIMMLIFTNSNHNAGRFI